MPIETGLSEGKEHQNPKKESYTSRGMMFGSLGTENVEIMFLKKEK
jgi:hypothetical protein